jgi:hypothetical protein
MPPRSTSTYIPSEEFPIITNFIDNCLTRLPKTYPTLATPVFTLQKPTRGISRDHEVALQKAIHAEAQVLRGSEMVFQVRVCDLLSKRTLCYSVTHNESF